MLQDFKFKGQPLTQKAMETFINLMLSKDKEVSLRNSAPEIKNTFPAGLLLKRMEAYKLPYEISDFFLCMCLMTWADRAGWFVLLLYICHRQWQKKGIKWFGIEQFAELFPWGGPTKEECETFWDSQKGPKGESLIDDPAIWISKEDFAHYSPKEGL